MTTAITSDDLLYGLDKTTRIVAVELAGQDRVRIFSRTDDQSVTSEYRPFEPWLITTDQGVEVASRHGNPGELAGDAPFRHLVRFQSWRSYRAAVERLTDLNLPVYRLNNPVDQYLAQTGQTLFKGIDFSDLLRMQIDIETTSLDARTEAPAILAIAIGTNQGYSEVLVREGNSETEILQALGDRIREIDPDVLEGHNFFNFDLPFLIERARRCGVSLNWGRDDSPVRQRGTRRFKAGARTIPFQAASIYGRHIIDTYQQIQRYDHTGELPSYGLKEAIESLGLTRADRVFVPGTEIGSTWETDRERVLEYALHDISDVNLLSSLATPTEFYQSQILPRSFQDIAQGGPGEKINLLMTRVYLSTGQSLPHPQHPRSYPGGYTELRQVGIFKPVVKCDVESLYPAIMLADRIAPASDVLGTYLDLLRVLTTRRIQAKRMARETEGAEQAQWAGMQSSLKVLINSFYGYLGYSRALFNDYQAAERVTLRGQEIIRSVVSELEHAGADPIEIDTDGAYFQPPAGVRSIDDEEAFVAAISATLPDGINLAHDGSFAGMISLRTKNYVLLTHEGRTVLKGSSLRSRREERFLRRFIEQAAREFIGGSRESVREMYISIAEALVNGNVPLDDFTRSESVTEKTFTSDSNKRLASAAAGERIGERITVYQRVGGDLARASDYQNDEDTDYLLRRLNDMSHRFEPLFDDATSFDYVFPLITTRTDLQTLRESEPVQQLTMFGG